MDQRYTGKNVVVTGAGSGIGRAVAQRLAAEGAKVACLDLIADNAAETAQGIIAAGGSAFSRLCDVSDYADVDAAVAGAIAEFGSIDMACNIAGIGWFAKSHEESPERFAKVIAVNLIGTFNVCRAVLPAMVERQSGAIINTASTAGLIGQPWSAGYCASKGGVVMLTKALATEYKGLGVRVNAVAPGGTMTNIVGGFMPPKGVDYKLMDKIQTPMGMTTPEEMASVFAFIGCDEARYMTGSIVAMDGGISC